MPKTLIIKNKIKKFNKQIQVSGDKSLSIRWVLLASQAIGKSKGYNLLMSEDVLAAIDSIKKLGIKVRMQKNYCEIVGNGINGFKYKKNLTIDAKNSGTLGRLILGLLIKSPKKIKIIGDKSLSKRDFSRVTIPLEKFGVKFSYKTKNKLPLTILGTQSTEGIEYLENKGSAQCKSSVMLAALNATGTTSYTESSFTTGASQADTFSALSSYDTSIDLTIESNFVEIKAGGIQVVSNPDRYVRINRVNSNTTVAKFFSTTSTSTPIFKITGSFAETDTIVPSVNDDVNLGATARRWKTIYGVTGNFSGNITAYASSDERLKDNIVTLDGSLDKVLELRGTRFDWIKGNVESNHTATNHTRDLTLTVMNSANNVTKQIKFVDAYPTTISSLPFDITTTDVEYLTAIASFSYSYYEFI